MFEERKIISIYFCYVSVFFLSHNLYTSLREPTIGGCAIIFKGILEPYCQYLQVYLHFRYITSAYKNSLKYFAIFFLATTPTLQSNENTRNAVLQSIYNYSPIDNLFFSQQLCNTNESHMTAVKLYSFKSYFCEDNPSCFQPAE